MMVAQHRFNSFLKYSQRFLLLAIVLVLLETVQIKALAQPLADPVLPAPQLTSPADYVYLNTLAPKLSWTAVPGAKAYSLQVSSSQDFSTGTIALPPVSTTSYTLNIQNGLNFERYYWKVEACDTAACSSVGSPSPVRRFTLTINKTPAQGAYSTSQKPTFSWASIPGATDYNLSLFSSIYPISNPVYEGTKLQYTLPASQLLGYGKWAWTVCVTLAGVGQPICTPGSTLIVTQALPPAPLLSAPAAGRLYPKYVIPNFSWQALNVNTPGGSFTYQIQVDTLSSFIHPAADVTVDSLSYMPAVDFSDGNYYWRVRAINAVGAAGKWSTARAFTIDTVGPAAPLRLSPADFAVITSTRPTFKWSKSTGAARYELSIISNGGVSYDFDRSFLKTTSYTLLSTDPPLVAGQKYFWFVLDMDAAGNPTNGGVIGFNLSIAAAVPAVPAVPTLVSPGDKALVGQTPALTWSLDSNGDNEFSEIQVSTSSTFQTILMSESPPQKAYQWGPVITHDGTYYWRVRAFYGLDDSSPWSAARSFSLKTTQPNMPVLLSPSGGALLNSLRPTFKWSAVPGAVSYLLQVKVNGNSMPPVFPKTTSYTFSSPLDYGEVIWTVLAQDAYGNLSTPQGPNNYFYTTLQISPAPNAHTSSLRPTFKWAAIPGATGSTTYTLNVISHATPVNAEIKNASVNGTSYTPTVDLAGPYTWEITVPGLAYAVSYNLYITPVAPAAPLLLTPANQLITNKTTLHFSWTSVASATHYVLQYSLSPDFPNTTQTPAIVYTVDINNPAATYAMDILPTFLPPAGQNWIYYWRVDALNSDAASSKWSTVRSFTLDTTNPGPPTLLSPANNGSVTNPQLSLSWSAVPDAFSYEVIFTSSTLLDPNNNPYPPPTQLGKVTSYKLPVTIGEGSYSWAVRAYDAAGNVSLWSGVQTFTMLAGLSVPKAATPGATVEPSLTPTPLATDPIVVPSATRAP